MVTSLIRTIGTEDFVFDCRRAILWARRKILIASDLHWGKTQFLRSHGIAISDRIFDEDLLRLSKLVKEYNPETVLVLGDLIHHQKSLSSSVIEKVAYFRNEHPCEFILLKGNHDRYTKFPESWGIVEENDFYIDDFYFSHEFKKEMKDFQFSGHIHPLMRLRSGVDELRLPSFILGEEFCLLPAFSHLTGGQDVKLEKGQSALVLLENGIEIFEK